MDDKRAGLFGRWETPNAPYDWHWPSRYCLAAALFAGAILLLLAAAGSLSLQLHLSVPQAWVAGIGSAGLGIWALVVARELGKLALVGAALWLGYDALTKMTASLHDFEGFVISGFSIAGWYMYNAHKELKALRDEVARLREAQRHF